MNVEVVGHIPSEHVSAFMAGGSVQHIADAPLSLGSISVIVDLPSGVGGSMECAVAVGSVDITAPTWTAISSNHYETSDYETASQALTIMAQAATGGVTAILS